MEWSDLEIQKPIGKGSYGCVYLASWHETPVAVKIVSLGSSSNSSRMLTYTDSIEVTGRVLTLSNPELVELDEVRERLLA